MTTRRNTVLAVLLLVVLILSVACGPVDSTPAAGDGGMYVERIVRDGVEVRKFTSDDGTICFHAPRSSMGLICTTEEEAKAAKIVTVGDW